MQRVTASLVAWAVIVLSASPGVMAGPGVLAASHASAGSLPDLSGTWRIVKPVHAVRTVEGRLPPLTAEAAKIYQAHLQQRRDGDTSFDSATWCAAVGMPRAMFINSPFEIVVRPPYVAFFHEWNWWARPVYLDGALAADQSAVLQDSAVTAFLGGSDPVGPMGLALGKWDGDTLVIETSNLLETTLIDNAGLPHSDAMKLTERLRLQSPDVLEDRIRVEDPKTFSAPWETRVIYRRQRGDIQEDVCLDRLKAGKPAIPD